MGGWRRAARSQDPGHVGQARAAIVAALLALLLVGLVVAVAGGAGGVQPYSTYESTVAADGPVALYRFDDAAGSTTLADSAGTRTATNTKITLGGVGPFTGSKSGAFAGSAFAALPSSPLAGATAFSAEAWVNWTGGSSFQQPIFDFGSSTTNWLSLTPASSATNHPLTFEIRPTTGTAALVTAPELTAKAWEYVAVTETTGGVLTLYLNGKQVGQATGVTLTPSSLGTTSNVWIGKSQVTTDPLFNGGLSNVAFYAKTLTAAQVLAHYNAGEFPVNSVLPTITGTAKDGQKLTAAAGTWTGVAPITFGYQWNRCNTSGASCTAITSATSSTYNAVPADVGSTLLVGVTGTNSAGTGTANSAATGTVTPLAPANTAVPVITGSAKEGQLLSASTGTWTGTPTITFGYQWESCSGSTCTSISGATASTYRLVSAQVGKTIKVIVTGTNAGGSATGTSVATATVTTGAPVNTALPAITGTAKDGQVLTASPGTWAGTATITFTYQWQSCNSTGGSCANISGATASAYTVVSGNVGGTLQVIVTAHNSVGTATATAPITPVVVATAPANTVLPAITGAAQAGQTLSTSTGTWTGTPTITFAYQWERCNTSGASCTNITGATASTYVLASADVGSTVRAIVTAANAAGSTAATSAATAAVTGVAPVNTVLPAITGTAKDGQTLTTGTGTWTGTAPLTYTYQWESCNSSGASCTNISGATSSSYTVVSGNVGATLRVVVTASNVAGSASSTSAATALVIATAPANTTPPAVSGAATDGTTLSASTGTWTGTPTISYAYQWQSCNSLGTTCANVSGATGSTYALHSSDVGTTLRVIVTATNTAGSAQATSAVSGVVSAAPPANMVLPVISGTDLDGQTLSVSTGTWTGTPTITYTYQWQRCNASGASCTNITGATSSAYALTDADVASTLRVVVTATNAAASTPATSAATATVSALAPSNTAVPAISGTPQDAQTLSANNGTWTGTAPLSYTYQWQSCGPSGTGCTNITGATSATYQLSSSNVGATVRVAVTASNAAGSASSTSLATPVVSAAPPANTALPAISGTATDGQTLTAGTGSWSGTPTITYSYQWQSCNSSGAACSNDLGATSSSYTLQPGDVGTTLRVTVTAANTAGSTPATSAVTGVVSATPPVNTVLPSVSGTDQDGQTLTANVGTWTGTPPITYSFAWLRCNATGGSCQPVSGASSATYQLTSHDVGSTLKALVSGANAAGFMNVMSPLTAKIAALAPSNLTPPSITGSPVQGQTLTASTGTWAGTTPLTFSYQWQDCNASGMSCSNISGATASTYVVQASDGGDTILVVVTATNTSGSASAASASTSQVPAAPANTATPVLSTSTPEVGHALTVTAGTWIGSPTPTLSYQWQDCNASASSCVNISSATTNTYTPVATDAGSYLQIVVTGTNTAGSASAHTTLSDFVLQFVSIQSDSTGPEYLSSEADGRVWAPLGGDTFGLAAVTTSGTLTNYTSGTLATTAHEPVTYGSDGDVWIGGTVPSGQPGAGTVSIQKVTTAGVATQYTLPSSDVIDSMTYGPDGKVWFIDSDHSQVDSITTSGTVATVYTSTTPLATIATGPDGNLWFSDGSQIDRLTPAGTVSHFALTSGAYLSGIAVGPDGNLWAVDANNQQVDKVTPGGTVTSYNEPSGLFGVGIAAGADGYLWISSSDTARLSTSGVFSGVYSDGSASPIQLSTGPDGRVWFGDDNSGGIFELSDGGSYKPLNVTIPEPSTLAPATGTALSVSNGTWSGSPTSFGYQWQDCNSIGQSCSNISGATSSSYTPGLSDGGLTLKVLVTATNGQGASAATSSAYTGPVAAAPFNTALPTISGTPQLGSTLTASTGTWTGSAPITYTYQWQRCDAAGENCAAIAGASAQTYTPTAGDVGGTLAVSVQASSAIGSASVTSATSVVVQGLAPSNTTPPTINGSAQDGSTLTATTGAWTGTPPLSYAYQWQRCDASGANCSNISGATDATYTLASSDVGSTLGVLVSASNAAGSSSASSAVTAVVVSAGGLASTSPPVISGIAQDGQTLSASTGTWTGASTTSYAYQWERCDTNGANCTQLAGAWTSTYTVGPADVGSTLEVMVTATADSGSASATSSPSGVVAALEPSNTGLPTISGTPQAGQPLTAEPGTWAGTPPLSYTYQWESCDSLGQTCTAIPGATSATYAPANTDVGNTLAVLVSASNAAGSASANSYATVAVTTAEPLTAPVSTNAPSIIGVAQAGETLYADRGSWSSAAPPSYAYQWLHCDAQGGTCIAIPDATGQTYQLSAADTNDTIEVSVTATNSAGSTSATSSITGVVAAAAPVNIVAPAISGTPAVGQALSVSTGTWASQLPLTYTYQWESCDPTGVTCVIVPGATSSSYTLTVEDATSTLAVVVSASSTSGTSSYIAALGNLITGGTTTGPVLQTAPSITGAAQDDQTLTADPGTWSDSGPITYAYQWESCDAQGENCSAVPGDTTPTYTTSDVDVGNTVEVVVTATAADGSTQAASSPTAAIAATGPSPVSAPAITGTAQAGQPLYVDPGNWNGTALDYAVQWQRCDDTGANCQNIAGATNFEYDLSAPDVGTTLTAVVTVSNSLASLSATPPATAVVTPAPTVSELAPPSISGTPADGQTLTAGPGTWGGDGTISYAYQWESCDPLGANCTAITGATSPAYTLSNSDVATTVAVSVTATDANGSLTDISAATQPIAPPNGPVLTTAPSITGTPQPGTALSASTGTWSGPTVSAFTYHWESCDATGSNCTPIDGATDSTYTPTPADVGTTIAVVVTATANGAVGSAYSAAVGPVAPLSLANVAVPTLTGTPQQGQPLSATPGTWSSSAPLVYSYQWETCDGSGHNCAAVPGQTNATYTPMSTDVGATIRVAVTAQVLFGDQPSDSEVVESDPSTLVAPAPPLPSEQTAPVISGQPIVGQQQTADPGTWGGAQPVNFTYQWQDCDQNGDPCTNIADATASTYTPTELDLYDQLAVIVTATNAGGTATATAYTATLITDVAPTDVATPSITGAPIVGQTLTADLGTWQGLQPITFTYQWEDCDQYYNCTDIPGATANTYTPTDADVGQLLLVAVTATNAAGSLSAGGITENVVNAPVAPADAPPVITGNAQDGQTLTATPGQWSGLGPITYAYQWQRCDPTGQNCTAINNATTDQYVLGDQDLGSTVTVAVTASNPYGSTTSQSSPTAVIGAGPPVAAPPMVQGNAIPGAQLTLGSLTAGGQGPITSNVQWQDCDHSLTSCANIPGATDATYTATEGDVGYTVAARVTFTNTAGSTTVTGSLPLAISDSAPLLASSAVTLNESQAQVGDVLSASASWEGSTPMSLIYNWQSCPASGGACTTTSGGATYEVDASDQGHLITVSVAAINSRGTKSATSAATYVEDPAGPPVSQSPPVIAGADQDGQTLSVSTGSWYEQPTAYSYQWEYCVRYGYLDCHNIAGATAATLPLTTYQVGGQIVVEVTATNASGSTTSTSALTANVAGMPPAATAPPTVDGAAIVGSQLQVDVGDWTGVYSVFTKPFSYSWQLCDPAGTNCNQIPDTLGQFYYTPTAGEIGDTLRVTVTGTSPDGQYSTTATSPPSAPIAAATPPANTTPPTISGTPQDTQSLRVNPGTWSGDPTITYTYQWNNCDPTGANCQPVADAKSSTYDPSSQDVGHALDVTITATNGGGSATETSSPTPIVQPAPPPVALFPPNVVSGGNLVSGAEAPAIGWQLAASFNYGGDRTTQTLSYQWLECDPRLDDPSSGNPVCVNIPGATASTYTVQPGDFGYELTVTVTASSQTGTATATSQPSLPVTDNQQVGAPTYDGPAVAGATITAHPNIVAATAPVASTTTYTFQYSTADGPVIAEQGANPNFTIPTTAAGQQLEITTNTTFLRDDGQPVAAPGAATIVSRTTTTPTIAQRPVPVITGTPIAGNQYTATSGTWPGDGSVPIAYQWQDCDANGGQCTNIAAATGPTYATATGDVGHTIRVVFTAGSGIDTATSPSAQSAKILPATAPQNTSPPQVTGTTTALQTLTADPGAWSGDQPITYTYQWQSCDNQDANCTDLAGADTTTYVPQDTDVGNTLQVVVTATNGSGAVTATSQPAGAITPEPAPENTQIPNLTVLGPNTDAATFSTDGGQWANLPAGSVPADLQYQWQTCDPTGANCANITGQTAQDFDATSADDGQRIRVIVTGQTDSGSASAASELSPPLSPSGGTLTGKLIYAIGTGLYTADLDGSHQTKISDCTLLMLDALGDAFTGHNCSFRHPAISPNGQMIAVNVSGTASGSTPCGSELGCLYTMNYDGSDAQQLPFDGDNPAWAPDGTALLYTGIAVAGGNQPTPCTCDPQVPNTQLFTAYLADPAATNSPVPMPSGAASTDTGAYSPDGGELAYSALDPATDTWSVYVASSDGTSPQPLQGSLAAYAPQEPAFTPDSQSVVFDAPAPTAQAGVPITGVYEAAVDPTGPSPVTPGNTTTSYGDATVLPNGWIVARGSVITSDVNDTVTGGGAASSCIIQPGAPGCTPLPGLPPNLLGLGFGPTTQFGTKRPRGPAGCNPGSACGDLGLVRQYAPIEVINGDDGFLPVSVDTITGLRPSDPHDPGPATSELCGVPNSPCPDHPLSQGLLNLASGSQAGLKQGQTNGEYLAYPGSAIDQQLGTRDVNRIYEATNRADEGLTQGSGPTNAQQKDEHYYYFVATRGAETEIEYWFYYTLNYFPNSPVPCGAQYSTSRPPVGPTTSTLTCDSWDHDLHQADWEHIDVLLYNNQLAGDPGNRKSGLWLDTCSDFAYFQHNSPAWLSGPVHAGSDGKQVDSACSITAGMGTVNYRPVAMDGTHPFSFSALGSHADYPYQASGAYSETSTPTNAWPAGGPDWWSCAGANGNHARDYEDDTAPTPLLTADYICDKKSWWASLSGPVRQSPRTASTYDIAGLSVNPPFENQLREPVPGNNQLVALAGPGSYGAHGGARFACWRGRFGGENDPSNVFGLGQSPNSPLFQQQREPVTQAGDEATSACTLQTG